jgi:general secretion pathway protein C
VVGGVARIGERLQTARDAVRGVLPGRIEPLVAVCAVLGLGLAVQSARLVWLFIEPGDRPVVAAGNEAAAPDFSVFARFDPFFRTGGQSSLAEATGADAAQMRLYGVRAGGLDGGSAIIGLADGRQVSVGVGEELEPGLTLRAVAADHVVLARGAALSRLVFTEVPPGAPQPPAPSPTPQVVTPTAPPAQTPAVGAAVDARRLVAQAGLRPRIKGLGVSGFTVTPSGDGAAVRAAGLRAGDVILSVDGVELNSPQAIAALQDRLGGASSAQIRFERNGVVQTTTVRSASQ